MRRFAGFIVVGLAVVAVVAAVAARNSTGAPAATGVAGEHDFGDKVMVVTMKTKGPDGESGGGYLEKVKVRKLGDQFFVVGQYRRGKPEWPATMVFWFPLSEVIQMHEYDSWEDAEKVHEAWKKLGEEKKEKKDQPLGR
jgi:hypothetical protein